MENRTKSNLTTELEKRLQFTALLAELSAKFVSISVDEIEPAIKESLQQIAENLNLDNVTIGEITPDGGDFFSRYHYVKPGAKPWDGASLMAESPLLVKTALSGQPFIMHDVDQLPPEAAADREGFLRYGIRADLVFPFVIGGRLRGGIGFASAGPRKWTEDVVQGLRLISDVFANVLGRRHSEQLQRENEQHMRLASDAADVGLWVWDILNDTIWATDKARTIYGIPAGDELDFQRFIDTLHIDDRSRVINVVENALQNGGNVRDEYRVIHPDQSVHWLCVSGHVQFDNAKKSVKMMGASIDVSEIRQAKVALKQTNTELKLAFEEIQRLKDQLQQENVYLWNEIAGKHSLGNIVSQSKSMRSILLLIEQVAPTSASVLITGETGTGKELIASAIHDASARHAKPMIKVNCAAIPAALIESELFGREKGAYTGALAKQIGRFELANGSSIFLDEIGELSLEAQAKLLRVLQEKEIERLGNPTPIKVDVRLIAATNRNLLNEVAEGRFREDLYYRLNVFPIHLPPLRDRREDIPRLVTQFVEEFSKAIGKPVDAVAKSSLKVLCGYDWPGNIRELRNVIERAVILAKGPVINIDLPAVASGTEVPVKSSLATLEVVERDYIIHVLEKTGWRVRGNLGAAEILGLKPSTLESRMLKLGIKRPIPS